MPWLDLCSPGDLICGGDDIATITLAYEPKCLSVTQLLST